MKRIKMFFIDGKDFDVNLQDAGPCVAYSLTAAGDNFEELCEDCTIFESDSEGETLRDYSLGDAQEAVYKRAIAEIENYLGRRTRELIEAARDYKTNQAIAVAKEGY